jgi:hypothetical protein
VYDINLFTFVLTTSELCRKLCICTLSSSKHWEWSMKCRTKSQHKEKKLINLAKFRYLGMTLTNQNSMYNNIKSILHVERCVTIQSSIFSTCICCLMINMGYTALQLCHLFYRCVWGRLLMKMVECKNEEVTRGWRKMHNELKKRDHFWRCMQKYMDNNWAWKRVEWECKDYFCGSRQWQVVGFVW